MKAKTIELVAISDLDIYDKSSSSLAMFAFGRLKVIPADECEEFVAEAIEKAKEVEYMCVIRIKDQFGVSFVAEECFCDEEVTKYPMILNAQRCRRATAEVRLEYPSCRYSECVRWAKYAPGFMI